MNSYSTSERINLKAKKHLLFAISFVVLKVVNDTICKEKCWYCHNELLHTISPMKAILV